MSFESFPEGGYTWGQVRDRVERMFRSLFLGAVNMAGPVTFGTDPDYAEFEADGTLVYHGGATVWEDIQGNLAGRLLESTAGKVNYNWLENTITFQSGGVITNQQDRVIWNIQLPHARKTDSEITLHFHWEQVDAVAREFTFQYRVQAGGDAKTTGWQTVVVDTSVAQSAYPYVSGTLNQITGVTSIDLTGVELSSVIQFRMARTDAVAGDIEVTFVDCHAELDTDGSREAFVK